MVVKLIVRILIFSSIILLVSYLALYINPDYKNEYVAGINPKLEKLKTTKGKKIVIIGGSNASFGIDTDLMEIELGIPVINMSLHGGLPLKYIIEQVKGNLNKDDVLILSKEYSGLKNQYWNKMSGTELPKIITYDWSQFKILMSDKKLFESTITGVFKTIKYYIAEHPIEGKKEKKSVYSLEAFEGDNLKSEFIVGKYTKSIKSKPLKSPNKEALFINGLKEYKEYYDNKGVKFYLTPPVIVKGYHNGDEILPFWTSLSESTGVSMLNKDKKYTYDKRYFFNSHYHTNPQGRERRTLSLIEDILEAKIIERANKKNVSISITKRETLNKANLDMFNKMKNFKVVKKSSEGIRIKQSGDLNKNYFRMRIEDHNYEGYNLYLKVECDEDVLENIRFRGIGEKEKFDTIINLGNKKYEFWKKIDKVFYSDNNSYIGIAFSNTKKLLNKELVINDVGLYQDLDSKDLIFEKYVIKTNGDEQYLKIQSTASKVYLEDVVAKPIADSKIELRTNRLYRINKKEGNIILSDFYTGEVLFRKKNMIAFIGSTKHIIRIFKQI